MASVSFLLQAALLLGCYESHQATGVAADAAAEDAFVSDVVALDVLRADAHIPDSGGEDGGTACARGLLRRMDEQRVEWPELHCGGVQFPEVVAVDGPNGPFQLVTTELRFCDDRPGLVWTRRASVGDRLSFDEPSDAGLSSGPAYAASQGDAFAFCSGADFQMYEAGGPIAADRLRPELEPFPGCSRALFCTGLARDGDGWGATWRVLDCDVTVYDMTRSGRAGGLLAAPFSMTDPLVAIASADSRGFAALWQGPSSGGFFPWLSGSPAPDPLRLDTGRGPVALSRWQEEDTWALITAEDVVRIRIFNESGATVRTHEYPLEVPGYAPDSVDVARAPWGLVVAVSYGRTGGRIDMASRVLAVDFEGGVLLDDVDADLGVAADAAVRVDVSDRDVLVHRIASSPDPSPTVTSVRHYRCI